MNPLNSSTSSSDEARERKRGWALAGWTLVWLVILDFAAGILFAYPRDPKNLSPNPLALYFDYGRSMEGRLRRGTRADPAATAPITLAGWYEPQVAIDRPAKPGAAQVTIYGMSHAVRLADALQAVSPRYQVRSIGAPGATMNWSYGAFLRDSKRRESKVAVLAIMSSTLPMIVSPTAMDWNTSFAMPYTADRFVVAQDGLRRIKPPYESFAGYIEALDNPERWRRTLTQFARTDPFYDGFLVKETWLDNSTLARLARRAWSQRRDQARRAEVYTADGALMDSEPVRVANAIISDFAKRARAEGIVPVIYVVDSLGFGTKLTRALQDTLSREDIAFISTSALVSPDDARGYLPDSHFTDANDRRLAERLATILDAKLTQ